MFEAILMSKAQADALELFLTEEYCVENLHFIWDVRSYKDKVQNLDLSSKADRDTLADFRERIKTDYLLPSSNKEVNLPSLMRKEIFTAHERLKQDSSMTLDEYKDESLDVFDRSENHVVNVLVQERIGRFYTTACYANAVSIANLSIN
ncbi:hypothetical protein HDV06_005041 [Boothiomyces sp. JEL0866]|nr:hypothetical protein HDV06_005041 [Boothiomyces sp. JEL0866]